MLHAQIMVALQSHTSFAFAIAHAQVLETVVPMHAPSVEWDATQERRRKFPVWTVSHTPDAVMEVPWYGVKMERPPPSSAHLAAVNGKAI